MNLDQVISISPAVVACELGDGVALLQTERNIYYTLNVVGSAVFDLIDNSRSIGEIIERIRQRYDISQDVATTDVLSLLSDLEKEKLVVLC